MENHSKSLSDPDFMTFLWGLFALAANATPSRYRGSTWHVIEYATHENMPNKDMKLPTTTKRKLQYDKPRTNHTHCQFESFPSRYTHIKHQPTSTPFNCINYVTDLKHESCSAFLRRIICLNSELLNVRQHKSHAAWETVAKKVDWIKRDEPNTWGSETKMDCRKKYHPRKPNRGSKTLMASWQETRPTRWSVIKKSRNKEYITTSSLLREHAADTTTAHFTFLVSSKKKKSKQYCSRQLTKMSNTHRSDCAQ